jgi:hypothetical protein
MAVKGTAVAKAKINLPVDVNASMAAEVAEIKKRISAPSGDRITVTQGKTFKLPNGLEVEEFEGVVVDFVAANYYYTESFDRGNIMPPVCFAISLEPASMVPSANSPESQGVACASCWANQFGSAGKGKACQNTRLLGLLPLDADANTPISILKVSPTAIRAFDGHVANVARKHGMPIRAVATKFSFSDEEYASVRFTDMGLADKGLVLEANARKADVMARLLTEPNVVAANDDIGNKKPAARGKPAPAKKVTGKR